MSDRKGRTNRGKGGKVRRRAQAPGSDAGRGLALSIHPGDIYRSCQTQTHRCFLDLTATCSEQVHKLPASCGFCGFSIHLCLEPGAGLGQHHDQLDQAERGIIMK